MDGFAGVVGYCAVLLLFRFAIN